ncbi:MAG TPA: Tol-Pal system beta propeller repeat protein TolB [Syntrophales bacterium]|jgi:TolB protein|nr:Tol-Pal system beta propeller repeat protein TolB [Syntrophales bacterium]HRT60957.1 Tol-Pal system beta propeller repeat protein TolB [Syntrophales bacterium]
MKYVFSVLMAVMVIAGTAVDPAVGKVYIDIDSPAFQKFPIAVPDFSNLDGNARADYSAWFSDALSRSLMITGLFNIVDKKAFLGDPKKTGITAESIRFPDWVAVGVESLVTGGYRYNGKELTVEFRLFDVVQGKLLVGKKYFGTLDERREMVLRFANEIILALTGEKGLFNTRIAFSGKKGGVSEIYAVSFDGTDVARLTGYQSLTMLPRWSPDGKRLSFVSYRDGNPQGYLMDVHRRTTQKIASYPGLNLPSSWSADGKRMLVTLSKDGSEDIYMMDVPGGSLKRLTNEPSIEVSPSWSPDGRQFAFVSDRAGSPQIYVKGIGENSARRLTYEGGYNTSPAWSPRGNRIVYEGREGGRFQVFVIGVDGSLPPIRLTADDSRNDSPAWSPDGRYIVFVSKRGGKSKLCVMNSNGMNVRVLHEGFDGYSYPSWSPR